MFGLGLQEVLVLCLIGLLLFGKNLPDLARSLGKTLGAVNAQIKGAQQELDQFMR
jgi:sec-independent protein translocase protein TatA